MYVKKIHGWINGWMDGWMDEQIEVRDGWMDYVYSDHHFSDLD